MIVRRIGPDFDMTFGQGLANYARDAEATGQSVKTRLQLLREEWFLDTTAGVPYLQEICVKPENLPLAESEIKRTILETVGVASIESFELIFTPETRRLVVRASVRTIYDDITSIQVNLL